MKAGWVMAGVAMGWVLGGFSAAGAYGTNQAREVRGVARWSGRVDVQFTSGVADPYYVLSGPAESYRAFRFNAMFREALNRYAAAKSGSGGGAITLLVHLDTLTTGYRQLGAGVVPEGPAFALGGPVRLAAAGLQVARGPGARLSHFREGDGDLSVPAEITKSAALGFSAELRAADRAVNREALTASAEVTMTWDDWDPWGRSGWNPWAYDYGPVLEALTWDAMARIDGFVDAALRTPGK